MLLKFSGELCVQLIVQGSGCFWEDACLVLVSNLFDAKTVFSANMFEPVFAFAGCR